MKPIENLKSEHERIVLVIDILERMSEQIASGENDRTDHLKQVIKFLQVFADKCHHGKEENYLFTAMLEAGVPEKGGPLGVMFSEHSRGRGFIEEMNNLLDSYEKGGSGSLMVLTTPALQYVDLLRSHIWKEDNVLYPMAEKVVPADKLGLLQEQFDRFEEEEIGQGTRQAFNQMIEQLSKIYLSRVVEF
jgi:hemerythrin-like domain-containing protein